MPQRFIGAVRVALYRERNSFVGKTGSFTRSLLAKKNRRGGTWAPQAAGQFRGVVDKNRMTLRMGANLSGSNKPFPTSIAKMQEGYTQTTGKRMMVPFYQNIAAEGIEYSGGKKTGLLASLKNKDITRPFWNDNRLFIVSKNTHAILFMESKQIRVPKQVNFIERWEARIPAAVNRIEKAIETAIVRAGVGKRY
jgi:hypothetical protein